MCASGESLKSTLSSPTDESAPRRMATLTVLSLLLYGTDAFVAPWKPPPPLISRHGVAKMSSAAAVSAAPEVNERKSMIHAAALGVGTACMGTAYAKCLKTSVSTVWTKLPAAISLADPTLFIPMACTLGGLIVGLTAVNLKGYTMPELIGAQQSTSEAPGGDMPSKFIAPVLLLSLLTSTFGFSVGPEAPMVVAGSLVGSAYGARVWGASAHKMRRIMAYTGAAGALTTFIGMPLAGAIFVLEITRASSGLNPEAYEALTPAVVSSCASMLMASCLLKPASALGGHFTYDAIGSALTGRPFGAIALAAGLGGALLGRIFVAAVSALKKPMWPQAPAQESCEVDRRWACGPKTRHVLVKTCVGLLVGILSRYFPQTLFWGEGSLQHVLDGQRTALAAVWPGLSEPLTAHAIADVTKPFATASAALAVGAAKLCAIALACAGGFPGGIIFPLFFASAAVAHGFAALMPASLMPVWVMSLMAATQASVTRTPLATVFMLGLSASASSQLSVLLPPVIIASYTGVWFSSVLSTQTFFTYKRAD